MKNLFNILLTSRSVWIGLTSIGLGILVILLKIFMDIDLPFDAPPEILILGGLYGVYAKGGKEDAGT